jgi:hypothetical protein
MKVLKALPFKDQPTNQRSNWGGDSRGMQVDTLGLLAIPALFALLAR